MGSHNKQEYSYSRLHSLVYEKKGKASFCTNDISHKGKRFEWANISGKYKNVDDFMSLCVSCHRKMDYTEEQKQNRRKSMLGVVRRRTPVKQLDKNGKLVKTFYSISEASRTLGILITSINNCIKGRTKTSGGFIWKQI